jgi:hypothetical protein
MASTAHSPGGTSGPRKRPRLSHEASSHGGVDGDEQQQQTAKRGRSCRRQDS